MRLRNLLLTGLLAGGAACLSDSAESTFENTEILWDEWGVPHIYATDESDLLYAFGWAQAHSHGNLVLRLYLEARGRAAEVFGRGALDSDRWMHTVGIPDRAQRWWQEQEPRGVKLLEAFAAGFNDYVTAHPDRIDPRLRAVAPVAPADILAHIQRVIHFTFLADSRLMAPRQPAGSNGWAVGQAHSSSGHSMLLINPHLPWNGRFTWYEAHLVQPDLNAYGAALVGIPMLGVGFNDSLGWTHTVNTLDASDLYRLRSTGDTYTFDGESRTFTTRTVTLRVRDEDSMVEEPLTVRESIHGPVVVDDSRGRLALRVAGLDRPHMASQWWAMIRATSLEEFEASLRRLQVPLFTVLYADREGHILHLFGGAVPKRGPGDWNWAGVVPGDTSATLWDDFYDYDQLPRVLDPDSGWLQNANDPPWTTTFPSALDPSDYAPGIAPSFMSFRAQRSARLLLADSRLTLGKLIASKHSTRMELADRVLDDLLPAAARAPSEKVRQAARILASWDRRADALSRGGPLFASWFQRLRSNGERLFSIPWDPEHPLETPDGLASGRAALKALEEAVRQLEADFGRADVEWGEAYRLRLDDVDLPASGGPGGLGIFRVINFQPDPDGRMRGVAGDSFVAAIRFSEPIEAYALTTYGNASQSGSPHRTDQLKYFSDQRLRPVWLTRDEVEAHTEDRKVF